MIDEAKIQAEAKVCRVLAWAFANVPARETLVGEDAVRACGLLGRNDMADAVSDLARIAACATEDDLRAMRVDYTSICCGASVDAPLPYSSIYSSEGRFLKGTCCTALFEEYTQAGFVPETAESNEPEDFWPTLLDYVAFRCEKACAALADGDGIRGEEEFAKAWAFKANYIDAWVPRYCAEAREVAATPYYQGILDILEAYCAE